MYVEDPDKVAVSPLLDLVVENYRDNKHHSTYDTQRRIDKHLRPFFGQKRASEIGTKLLKEYRRKREASHGAEATINKELTWLRRAFNSGTEHEPQLVLSVPHFPIVEPDNVREGIIPHQKYRESQKFFAAVRKAIVCHLGSHRRAER